MRTKLLRVLIPPAALAALVLAQPGFGQSPPKQSQPRRAGQPTPPQDKSGKTQDKSAKSQDQAAGLSVSGKIESTEEVKLRNSNDKALLATIKTDDGKRLLVDLGGKKNLKDLKIVEGTPITAQGQILQFGMVEVLLASRVTANDHTATIKRSLIAATPPAQPAPGEGRGYSLISHFREVSGSIEAIKKVKLRNSDVENLVVSLKTEKGRKIVVDLGPANDLKDFDFKKGDHVIARGSNFEVQGKRVLLAGELQSDGETVTIDRKGQLVTADVEKELKQIDRKSSGSKD